MRFRDHPLMSYKDLSNWPPVWTWVGGGENEFPKGEVGMLRMVELSQIQPADRCFLQIDHNGSSYVGCLLFDDSTFCVQIATFLKDHCNRSIAEIGNLDLSHTL